MLRRRSEAIWIKGRCSENGNASLRDRALVGPQAALPEPRTPALPAAYRVALRLQRSRSRHGRMVGHGNRVSALRVTVTGAARGMDVECRAKVTRLADFLNLVGGPCQAIPTQVPSISDLYLTFAAIRAKDRCAGQNRLLHAQLLLTQHFLACAATHILQRSGFH